MGRTPKGSRAGWSWWFASTVLVGASLLCFGLSQRTWAQDPSSVPVESRSDAGRSVASQADPYGALVPMRSMPRVHVDERVMPTREMMRTEPAVESGPRSFDHATTSAPSGLQPPIEPVKAPAPTVTLTAPIGASAPVHPATDRRDAPSARVVVAPSRRAVDTIIVTAKPGAAARVRALRLAAASPLRRTHAVQRFAKPKPVFHALAPSRVYQSRVHQLRANVARNMPARPRPIVRSREFRTDDLPELTPLPASVLPAGPR